MRIRKRSNHVTLVVATKGAVNNIEQEITENED
jgi:hypothetical protein